MACKCEKKEVGQGSGTVKGYITTVECDECKAKREADNAARELKEAEAKEPTLEERVKALEEKLGREVA